MKFLFFLFCCFTAQAQCLYYRGVCQAGWMGNLSTAIKQRPISQIKLLGTHDSGAYELNLTATTAMEETTAFDWFKVQAQANDLIYGLLQRLTFTQPLTIIDQLEQGIRAFDFRILYNSQLKEFFISHSFATVLMDTVLNHIQSFLSRNSGELVIVEMKVDSEHVLGTRPYENLAIAKVQSVLGDYLIPVTANQTLNDSMTLQNLVDSNQRVLFTFTDLTQSNYGNIWPAGVTVDNWPNGQNVSQSMTTIETYLPQLKVPRNQYLDLVFFTVTPDQNSDIAGIVGQAFSCGLPLSLFDWANQINPAAINFIHLNLANLSGLNIVSLDAPSDDDVRQVISLN